MRRKEKQRDTAFAWQALKEATHSVISMVKEDGKPYAVPVNHVADEKNGVIYFHCASAGEKLDAITAHPDVCLVAVGYAALVPHHLTTDFRSAVVKGTAALVEDEGEILHAIRLLTAALDPVSLDGLEQRMARTGCMQRMKIVKILPVEITGKESVEQI